MRTKYKCIKINDRFSISADQYNFILKDKDRHTKDQNSYYNSAEIMVKEICSRYEKDFVLRGEVGVGDYMLNNALIGHSMERLIRDITLSLRKKLEQLKKDLE